MIRRPPRSTLLSLHDALPICLAKYHGRPVAVVGHQKGRDTNQRLARNLDRKSTRLNSSHHVISYAVFCLKKKQNKQTQISSHQGGATRKAPYEVTIVYSFAWR